MPLFGGVGEGLVVATDATVHVQNMRPFLGAQEASSVKRLASITRANEFLYL